MSTKNPKQRSSRIAITLIALAILSAVALASLQYLPIAGVAVDRYRIGMERAHHRALARAGMKLPGTPDLENLDNRLSKRGFKLGSPMLMRIFKREHELEIWFKRDGRFHRFETYPICRWSGRLGPKLKTGDYQAPEGFYTVSASQLNPNSRWHRSFNLGYPNAYDRAHKRTGSFLMVHGGCSSSGCYAMTNDVIDEIWKIVNASLDAGQKRFQVQVYPFRMTDRELARYSNHRYANFWSDLKIGHDLFAESGIPPQVSVCNHRYVFARAQAKSDGSRPITQNCRIAGR